MPRPRTAQPTITLVQRAGRWYVRWWEDGGPRRVSCRTTDPEAAERFRASFIAGRATPAPPPQPTIGEILDGYLKDREGHVAAHATLEFAAARLKAHLAALIPAHLTRERVRAYRAARHREGVQVGPPDKRRRKPISDGTIIRELVTLRAALRWAQRERWISEIPHVETPSMPPARDRWLTREEAMRLLDACQAPHLRLFVTLALNTAARATALLELRWAQVDLRSRLISPGRGSGNKRRAAALPINDTLATALAEAWKTRTTDFVVEFGSKPVRSVKGGFNVACQRAGLADVTPHTLRHTAATWMIQAGIPFGQVAQFLGNSVTMVEKVYGHHSPDWLGPAARALG